MKQKRRILSIFFLFSFLIAIVQGQETITTTGGNISGSGGSVSYTVGQILYNTISGTNGTVAQGVQQPYEISVVTGIENTKDILLEIEVYPNPAKDYLKLKIGNYDIVNLSFQLYDIKGNLLLRNRVDGNETNILMNPFIPSTYFLKVIDKKKVIKIFKVIKN
jgi:hypothetical protein